MTPSSAARCIEEGRSPILLTERKDHLEHLATRLRPFVRHLVVLQGGMTPSERREVAEQLEYARSLGDLSENGYYKESRARLSFIDGRLRHFDRIIKFAEVVAPQAGETINFGSQVVISDGQKEFKYKVVGSFESDPVEFFDEDISGNCDPPVPYNGPAYYFPGCP